jgi:hypothetical protein
VPLTVIGRLVPVGAADEGTIDLSAHHGFEHFG